MSERKRGLTKKRRDAVADRDNNESQLQHYSEEKGWHIRPYCRTPNEPCPHIEIHHVKPHGLGGDDESDNLVAIPKCEHVGVCPSQRIKPGYYK